MLPQAGDFRVVYTPDKQLPYTLVGPDGTSVEPVQDYLLELLASDCSPLTIKSYAFDLLDWFRFLVNVGLSWDQADRRHVRDWVLETKVKVNPQRHHRSDRPAAGSVNPRTGKPSLRSGYTAATINHRLAVVAGFYEHQHRMGRGPAINPVPVDGRGEDRRNQRRSPLESWRPGSRGTYRQKQQRRIPRAIPDEQFEELFGARGSDHDRAIVSLLVCSGARAAELLSMTGHDVDWGNQRVRLITKGTREATWLAASDDFLRWLARYIARERPPLEPNGPLWVTLRRPRRPLAYGALRAVLLRVDEQLGANWTLHDFRHTCGMLAGGRPDDPTCRRPGALAAPAPVDDGDVPYCTPRRRHSPGAGSSTG
jgi:integrase